MSYYNCRQGGRCEDCNGYVGPLDTYVCPCQCHSRGRASCTCGFWREWEEKPLSAEWAQTIHDEARPYCTGTVTIEVTR